MRQFNDTQEAFGVIGELAKLCATPGIEETTLQKANVIIRDMLTVIETGARTLTAKSAGLTLPEGSKLV